MKFSEVVAQTLTWLQREGRVSYRALKREFELDDDFVGDLKAELIAVKELAVDKDGKMLVWVGAAPVSSSELRVPSSPQPPTPQTPNPELRTSQSPPTERRQLTVMFCDLVGSTALSARLDPEDLRAIIRQYQQTCAEVINRHEGYIAQYLGDGLLVYFGYPTAHEDDARRAVRSGLEIVEAIRGQGSGVGDQKRRQHPNVWLSQPLQVRIGLHTGLVVVGEIGSGEKRELLALGETPNIAARIQGLAEPNTILISAATQRLVEGRFEYQPFGSHLVKGIETPIAVYHVQGERQLSSHLESKTTLTPLVGREQEIGLLYDRWEQVKEGRGQVVLLNGEPGIGKSRLAYTLRERVTSEGSLLFEAHCSPYHQHSALYPLIEVLQRTLLLTRQDTDEEKVSKLERILTLYGMQNTLPLFTALLSLPTPLQYPSLNLTPQKQKERTLQVLLQLLVAQAERQATVSVWEDLHWADPSSLEFLTLLVEQVPTTKLMVALTFRPEFTPPWKLRSHITQITLNRLGKKHVEAMIEKVTAGKELSTEVIEQIRIKTDGVPLFVEELTKSVVESVESIVSVGSIESLNRTLLQLAIPATLQEALMARLDRLSSARQIAQLGATLGREFSYGLLQAVAPVSEADLQTALTELVEAEILYQRGVGQQERYFFKHALIQDTAYQSLLKSTRQQYHQQIARVLEEQFPDIKENQPELLAHHYTEANLIEQAIPYWQQAGQRAVERSANPEAISYFTKGLELLKTLPETLERAQQELSLQIALGSPLQATHGYGALEVEKVYARTRELCQQVGDTPQIFPVLRGLYVFYLVREELQVAHELAEHLFVLAQRAGDSAFLLEAHFALGQTLLLFKADYISARKHLEQGIALYDPQQHSRHAILYGQDPGVFCLILAAWGLWALGYPDQALKRTQEAIAIAHKVAHPLSLAAALSFTARLHQLRRETLAARVQAEASIDLSNRQGFPYFSAFGTIVQGWVLAEQGPSEEGVAQLLQGLAFFRTTGAEVTRPWWLAMLAEVHGKHGQAEEGLSALTEALNTVQETGDRFYEADLHRLKGELTLQSKTSLKQVSDKSQASPKQVENKSRTSQGQAEDKSEITDPRPPIPDPHVEAEACFLKAIEIARKQQAKSLELRASMSLARLWQQQGKKAEGHKLLADIYNWFTEGFDTKDLQEAQALIGELMESTL